MGLLADWQIKREVKIEPFAEEAPRPGVISYGVSSYGYDVRVGRSFKVFTNVYGAVIDPKKFDPSAFVDIEADFCIIPPNSFVLAETVESFEEHHLETAGQRIGEKRFAAWTACHRRRAGKLVVRVHGDNLELQRFSARPADARLILDRGLALLVGRVPCVDDRCLWHG